MSIITTYEKCKTKKLQYNDDILTKQIDELIENNLNGMNITSNKTVPTIDISIFNEIKTYYDEILNLDRSTYKTSNDEPTPIY